MINCTAPLCRCAPLRVLHGMCELPKLLCSVTNFCHGPRTWLINVSEDNAGDGQRNTQVDHPPRICLRTGHRTAVWNSRVVRVPMTIHCIASRVVIAVAILVDTGLIGGQVSCHSTHVIRVH